MATALAAAGALVAAAFALGGVAVYAATDDGLSVVAAETRTARPDVVSLALVGAGAAARLVVAERDAVAILALGDAAVRVLRSGDSADSVTDLLEEDRRPTASPVVRVVAGAAGAALVVAEGGGVERWAGS